MSGLHRELATPAVEVEDEDTRRLRSVGDATYRHLVEGVLDYAIFLLTPTGHIATWNAGAQRIKGYSPADIIGKHFSVFYTAADVSAGWPQKELMLARERGRIEDEGWRVRQDGSTFWANVVITAIYDSQNEFLGFAKVTRDLSDRRRMAALQDEGRRMTEFIAMLSHELRNPLSPIMNVLAIMAREPQSPRSQWCLDVAAKQVRHINRLVEDLLDVSRVTTGKVRLTMERLDLADVVKEAVEGMRPTLEERGHALAVHGLTQPLWLQGDRTRLIQLVSNLLNNSIKFTTPPGQIELTLMQQGAQVCLSVSDNGIGMEPDTLKRAFEPFSQAESRYSRSESGLGLGLALVRSIAQHHGGSAEAFSGGLGQGSVVSVRLPLIDESAASSNAASPSQSQGQGAHATMRRLLIVDDNIDAADSLAMLLRTLGHQVTTAHDGLRALELIREQTPDVVLLDIGMPMLSGLEVARHVRSDPSLAGVKLVAVSGYGQPLDKLAASSAGFDEHLVKPVDVEDVTKALLAVEALQALDAVEAGPPIQGVIR